MYVLTSFLLAAVAGVHLAPSPVAAHNRIAAALDLVASTRLPGSLHPWARPELDQGRVDGGAQVEGVSLFFRPSPEQQASLEALLLAQQDPASPDYRRWITPEQYAERFGLTLNDFSRVKDWLRAQGFGAIELSRNRLRVSFAGTVHQIEAAFRTEIHLFAAGGAMHFANATELSVPPALADLVSGVRNLDDFRPRSHHLGPDSIPAWPDFTSSISGNHFLAPDDFATIYDLKPLYAAGLDGSGESIAVVGQSAISLSDIDAFRTASGLAVKEPELVLVPGLGTSAVSSADVEEADLDLEWSGAVAKNALIVYVYTGNNTSYNAFDALQYAIDQNLAPVISVSYGNCESALGASNVAVIEQWAKQANLQGQTISAASGDTGAADCDPQGSTAASHGLAVDVPASIPEVTGLGGDGVLGGCGEPRLLLERLQQQQQRIGARLHPRGGLE